MPGKAVVGVPFVQKLQSHQSALKRRKVQVTGFLGCSPACGRKATVGRGMQGDGAGSGGTHDPSTSRLPRLAQASAEQGKASRHGALTSLSSRRCRQRGAGPGTLLLCRPIALQLARQLPQPARQHGIPALAVRHAREQGGMHLSKDSAARVGRVHGVSESAQATCAALDGGRQRPLQHEARSTAMVPEQRSCQRSSWPYACAHVCICIAHKQCDSKS